MFRFCFMSSFGGASLTILRHCGACHIQKVSILRVIHESSLYPGKYTEGRKKELYLLMAKDICKLIADASRNRAKTEV
jgi:hypothetical protein